MYRLAPLVALALLIAGCRVPSPERVSFPDDPRVLQGEWQLQLLTRMSPAKLVLDSTGSNLAVLSLRESWTFTRSSDDWLLNAGAPAAVHYDTTLDAFVTVQRADTHVLVELHDFAGNRSEQQVPLPRHTSPDEFFVASGRLFGLTPNGESETVLDWWNLRQPEDQGRSVLAGAISSRWLSATGRAVVVDDPTAELIHVVDTRNPGRIISLASPCGLYGRVDLSADGRWLVSGACGLKLRLHDLHDPAFSSRELPISVMGTAGARFAVDTPELVWVDTDHVIRSLDVVSGEETILYALSAQDLQDSFYDWTSNVHLHRAASLLVFEVAGGLVKVVDPATGDVTAELATLLDPPAQLDLQASIDGHTELSISYQVAGTFSHAGETLQVSGRVYGGADQVYVPAGMQPQWSSPRPLDIDLHLREAGSAEAQFQVWLSLDSIPGAYRGVLTGRGGELPGYQVRLERPAVTGELSGR